MGLYRTVLAEGQQQDLIDFLNRDLLISQWPVLRKLISRPLRDAWEAAFPELATARDATAAWVPSGGTTRHRLRPERWAAGGPAGLGPFLGR